MGYGNDNSVKIDLGVDKYDFNKSLGSIFSKSPQTGLNLDFLNNSGNNGTYGAGQWNGDMSTFMKQDFTKPLAEPGFLTKYNDQIALGMQGLGAVASLGNMYYAGQGLNYANKSLKENQRQFDLNFDMQAKQINDYNYNKHQARIANAGDGGHSYESQEDFMNRVRVA